MLHQSDLFSFKTVIEGKGGPFGAQLWLIHPSTHRYVIVGDSEQPENSNNVVAKGLASAHAEAENLSPKNRIAVARFLEKHTGEGWEVIQISSGESCQSCRAKQVLFAEELVRKNLLERKKFHIAFKATYQQTQRDTGFNDAPYDMTFRAIHSLDLLNQKKEEGLFGLEDALKKNSMTASLVQKGEIIFNRVRNIRSQNFSDDPALNQKIHQFFKDAAEHPAALILSKEGEILSSEIDQREKNNDSINVSINEPEKTAFLLALHRAAAQKRARGVFESWNLEGAALLTNIREIGPQAYAESLWYNLSEIQSLEIYQSEEVEVAARELPGMSNRDSFSLVADEYNTGSSPLNVVFRGDEQKTNIAHALWNVKILQEALLKQQANAIEQIEDAQITFIDGEQTTLQDLVETTQRSIHYNGKENNLEG